jgi:hypothetical protein
LAKSKAQTSMYALWKAELRKDFAKSLNDRQFEILLKYASELSDVYDIQANYVSELVSLFHSVTGAK